MAQENVELDPIAFKNRMVELAQNELTIRRFAGSINISKDAYTNALLLAVATVFAEALKAERDRTVQVDFHTGPK